MDDIRERYMCIKWTDTCIKTRVATYSLLLCRYSGEKGAMKDIKRDKCVHKVNRHRA